MPRHDLDRIEANGLHQGIALQVPPYDYAHPDDLLADATKDSAPALMVALDNISDPRNLGAIVRSVAAFGGHGVLIPQRRSASVTAVAWRTSAGAAARVPVARATNLNRTLKDWADAGLQVVGLDADGDTTIDELDGAGPMVVVVGLGGQGAVAAGAGELRRRGVDPDGRADGVAERFGGRRAWCWPRSPASDGVTSNFVSIRRLRLGARADAGTAGVCLRDLRRRERGRPPKVARESRPGGDDCRQCRRSGGESVRNRQRIKHFGGHSLVSQRGEVDTVAVPQPGIAELGEPPEVHQVHIEVVDDAA